LGAPELIKPTTWSRVCFAESLAALIEERGMTPRELARNPGIDAGSLHAALNGGREPARGLVEGVARALGVAPRHFLEVRIATLIDALEGDPARADALFLKSLSETERRTVDVAGLGTMPFGLSVRALLAEEELTQGELAEAVGYSQGELSHILNGHRRLRVDLLVLIAQGLGVSPEFFLAYRLLLLAEWFRDHPSELDAALETLASSLELSPYEAWPLRGQPECRGRSSCGA